MRFDEYRTERHWPDWVLLLAPFLNGLRTFLLGQEERSAQILTEIRALREEMTRPTLEITVGKPKDKEI